MLRGVLRLLSSIDMKAKNPDPGIIITGNRRQLKGCFGIKLYQPMGFAAFGNRDLKTKDGVLFWGRKWLRDWMSRRI